MSILTDAERAALTQELDRTRQLVIDAGSGLSSAQWKWKPAPDRWSVAECLEHIAIVEKVLGGRLQTMAAGEPDPAASARVAGREAMLEGVRTRSEKRQAPEMALPTAQYGSLADFEPQFHALRQANIDFARTTRAPLHALVQPHPALGELSAHQWLWFVSAHCERHAAQAREVRETPGFPAA